MMKTQIGKTIKTLLIVVLLLALAAPGQADEWNPITPPGSPTARFGHAMANWDGKIRAYGGEGQGGLFYNDLYAFVDNTWEQIPTANPPTARSGHSMVSHPDGKMYLFGGETNEGVYSNELYAFLDDTWTPITPAGAAPPARARHAMWSTDNSIYIAGGDATGGAKRQDAWRYDVAANTWQQVADAPVTFSGVHAVRDAAQKMVYILGLQSMLTYNEGADAWLQYHLPGESGIRTGAAVAQNGAKAWLFGGQDAGGTVWSTVYEFNFSTSRWQRKDTRMPVGLKGAAAASFDWHGPVTATVQMLHSMDVAAADASAPRPAVLLFGGVTSAGVVTNTTYVYFPDQEVEDILAPGVGTTLTYTDALGLATIVEAPPDAVSQTVGLALTALDAITQPVPAALSFAGHAFALEAHTLPNTWPAWQVIPGFVFSQPVTITLHYTDTDVTGIDENTLLLYYWDGSQWRDAASTCAPPSAYVHHPGANRLSVPICHLSEFALLGERGLWSIYLPLVVRQ